MIPRAPTSRATSGAAQSGPSSDVSEEPLQPPIGRCHPRRSGRSLAMWLRLTVRALISPTTISARVSTRPLLSAKLRT